jgi:hypothetical protein
MENMFGSKAGIECEPEDERTKRRRPQRRISHGRAMKIVRRKRSIFWCLAFVVIGLVIIAPGNVSALTPQEKLDKTIGNIQTFLIGIGIALAGVMVILAGTKWVTTRGHPEEQARVKHWLMDIGIGCILILSSTVMIEVAKGLIVK